MIEHYRQSEQLDQLATALAKAQAEVMKAHKDSDNPFFKSKYADLTSVWDAIREPLTKNGLAVVQFPVGEHGLMSILTHTSGQFMQGFYFMRPVKDDPQGRGSCLTYMRRYALQAIAGVCPEDDDGNAGSMPQGAPQQKAAPKAQKKAAEKPKEQAPTEPPPEPYLFSEEQIARLDGLAAEAGRSKEQMVRFIEDAFKVDDPKKLTLDQYNKVVARLVKMIEEAKK